LHVRKKTNRDPKGKKNGGKEETRNEKRKEP